MHTWQTIKVEQNQIKKYILFEIQYLKKKSFQLNIFKFIFNLPANLVRDNEQINNVLVLELTTYVEILNGRRQKIINKP